MKSRKFVFALVAVAATLIVPMGVVLAQDHGNTTTYRAELSALNSSVTGSEASGEVVITISGDEMTIHITVKGVPPDTMHLQHFHGFVEAGKVAQCATIDQDANKDGIVDVVETEPVSGTTMVPFHGDPVSMAIVNDTYPKANADGSYTYDKTVSLKALQEAFAKQFPDSNGELDLAHRVVYVHSIPDSQKLPSTVASLGDIPAQVTIPIACGPLELVGSGTPVGSPEATPAG